MARNHRRLNGCLAEKGLNRPSHRGRLCDIDVDIPVINARHGIYASIITPEIAHQRNERGYSWQPTPTIHFRPEADMDQQWQQSLSQFTTTGEYAITVKTKDHNGFIREAKPITIDATCGDQMIHPRFDSNTQMLHIPVVTVPNDSGEAESSDDSGTLELGPIDIASEKIGP
ncbi:MAG: hypothetical protein DRR19_14585 [Candidatus Parabeggiatoa sp. nov. 1]|nr:MAG: hypothetical protein DRR19_14585 [Gammaproteobacteria bacterium]